MALCATQDHPSAWVAGSGHFSPPLKDFNLLFFLCVYVSEFVHANVVPMEVRELIRFPGIGVAGHGTGNQA